MRPYSPRVTPPASCRRGTAVQRGGYRWVAFGRPGSRPARVMCPVADRDARRCRNGNGHRPVCNIRPMICRLWRGWTTRDNADAYERIVRGQVIPGIEARRIPGFRSIDLVRFGRFAGRLSRDVRDDRQRHAQAPQRRDEPGAGDLVLAVEAITTDGIGPRRRQQPEPVVKAQRLGRQPGPLGERADRHQVHQSPPGPGDPPGSTSMRLAPGEGQVA
jgi:hypothetical protein